MLVSSKVWGKAFEAEDSFKHSKTRSVAILLISETTSGMDGAYRIGSVTGFVGILSWPRLVIGVRAPMIWSSSLLKVRHESFWLSSGQKSDKLSHNLPSLLRSSI